MRYYTPRKKNVGKTMPNGEVLKEGALYTLVELKNKYFNVRLFSVVLASSKTTYKDEEGIRRLRND